MEYGQIFHVTHIGKYYCKIMKYRINIFVPRHFICNLRRKVWVMVAYIPPNTFTPVEERVLNRIKYYPRSSDFMMIKSLPKSLP